MQILMHNKWNLSLSPLTVMFIRMVLVLALFSGSVANATVTDNGTPSKTSINNGNSATWLHTVNSGVNRALFVEMGTTKSAQATGVTYAGLPLTRVFRGASASGNNGVEIWVLVAPPVGTANVVVSFSVSNGAICGATTFNGVKQSAPYGDFASASGSTVAGLGGLFNVSVTVASAPGDMVIDIQNWASVLSLSLGHSPGQRELWRQGFLVLLGITGGTTEKAGAASVTMSSSGISLLSIPYVLGALSITASPPMNLSGTVFEDVNYGGGAGRDRIAAGGVIRPGARVELFDGSGNYVTATTTDGSGAYTFSGLTTGAYTVRVVNSTVSSSRPGSIAGLLPVQTYRTDATSGTPVAVTDHVGGEAPDKVDAINGSTTLAALTTATTVPQSITTVTLAETDVSGVDFGFNFDTIVNKNDTGQGTLRQFINNANMLTNAGLAQVGHVAGNEASIFMIPDGNAHPGLRSGIVNQLTGGVAVIQLTTVLPPIVGNNTVIDGTTQTTNVGDTNPNGLEVEITGNGVTGSGLWVSSPAFAVTIRALAIHGFAGSGANGNGIYVVNAATTSIYGCYIGASASGAATLANSVAGITVTGTSSGTTIGGYYSGEGNLIAFNSGRGVTLDSSVTGTTIRGNTIRVNGQNGIYSAATGVLIAKNIINNNGGAYDGIWLDAGSSNAKVYQNTIHANGRDGIRVGDIGAIIKNNIFTGNSGYGINRIAASMTEAYNDVTDALTTPANAMGRSNVALDSSDLNVNPLYINAAGYNFYLIECTSPVINRGIDLGADQPDMNGTAPGLWNDNAPEMGALETIGSCSSRLTIFKRAFLDDNSGTELPTGSTVVKGTIVKFVIFIDNSTNVQASDLRIADQLDKTAFTYQAGSLKWNNNTTASAASLATIFSDTNSGVALSDAISAADAGSVDLTPPSYALITFGAHSTQTNAILNIPARKIASFMFRARVN